MYLTGIYYGILMKESSKRREAISKMQRWIIAEKEEKAKKMMLKVEIKAEEMYEITRISFFHLQRTNGIK